jgi:hypothetical protein
MDFGYGRLSAGTWRLHYWEFRTPIITRVHTQKTFAFSSIDGPIGTVEAAMDLNPASQFVEETRPMEEGDQIQ